MWEPQEPELVANKLFWVNLRLTNQRPTAEEHGVRITHRRADSRSSEPSPNQHPDSAYQSRRCML